MAKITKTDAARIQSHAAKTGTNAGFAGAEGGESSCIQVWHACLGVKGLA